MQASQLAYTARQRALAEIRGRVQQHVASWFKDSECVQIALSASLREPEETMQFLFRKEVAKASMLKRKQLALNVHEWDALFGSLAVANSPSAIENVASDEQFKTMLKRIEAALRCTIEERELNATWARPWTKAACVVAMHTETHEDMMSSSLGSVVRADSRRIEELRNEIDDDETETMMLANSLVALANAIF